MNKTHAAYEKLTSPPGTAHIGVREDSPHKWSAKNGGSGPIVSDKLDIRSKA